MNIETGTIDLGRKYRALLELMPELDDTGAKAALEIYGAIARTGVARPREIAATIGCTDSHLEEWLDGLPGVFRDDHGNIVGFWGLTAKPVSPHEVTVKGKVRYAWCAWDTLFLPRLLKSDLDVRSTCPQTKTPIRLKVTADRVQLLEPNHVVLSMLMPEKEKFEKNVVATFCHHVHFFPSEASLSAWSAQRNDVHPISLSEAFALGEVKNKRQFGSLIA